VPPRAGGLDESDPPFLPSLLDHRRRARCRLFGKDARAFRRPFLELQKCSAAQLPAPRRRVRDARPLETRLLRPARAAPTRLSQLHARPLELAALLPCFHHRLSARRQNRSSGHTGPQPPSFVQLSASRSSPGGLAPPGPCRASHRRDATGCLSVERAASIAAQAHQSVAVSHRPTARSALRASSSLPRSDLASPLFIPRSSSANGRGQAHARARRARHDPRLVRRRRDQ